MHLPVTVHCHQLEMGAARKAQLGREVAGLLRGFKRWIRGVTVRIDADAGEVTVATCCVLVDLHPAGGVAAQVAATSAERSLTRATLRMRHALADHLRRRRSLPAASRSGYGLLQTGGGGRRSLEGAPPRRGGER